MVTALFLPFLRLLSGLPSAWIYAVIAYFLVLGRYDVGATSFAFVVGRLLRCAHGHLAVSRLDGYHVPVSRDTPIRGCFGMTQCAKPSLYISRASHLDSTSSLLLATTIQT